VSRFPPGSRLLLAALAATALALQLSAPNSSPVLAGGGPGLPASPSFSPSPRAGVFVLRGHGGDVRCADATPAEADEISRRDPGPGLHAITPPGDSKRHLGLRIILRGTAQLENYPEAKAAYLRAAATWERAIQATPISILIDVDFGPTLFGQPPPPNVLGTTSPQMLLAAKSYFFIRGSLISRASNPQEAALYENLPDAAVPTDLGDTRNIYAPSAVFRALGFLRAEANDTADLESGLGLPPSIAIGSGAAFDFDPRDGIDPVTRDFEAVALHEMGHVLGFTSATGTRELSSSFPVAITVLDLFRFRPWTSLERFGTAKRILSSGGDQVLVVHESELPLSTGRPDGSGGDERQASHWKDEGATGAFIGLMHPALKQGVHETLTTNDLMAFDLMGYSLAIPPGSAITALSADLQGDRVILTGSLAEAGLDIAQAQVARLGGDGRPINTTAAFAVRFASTSFTLSVAGFDRYPHALGARLTLFDSQGAVVASAVADFSRADEGGPRVSKVRWDGSMLKVSGGGFISPLGLEVNGVTIAPPDGISVSRSGSRLRIEGTTTGLNLRGGFNRVRVLSGTLRSNVYVLLL
jgi:hypothetical protein